MIKIETTDASFQEFKKSIQQVVRIYNPHNIHQIVNFIEGLDNLLLFQIKALSRDGDDLYALCIDRINRQYYWWEVACLKFGLIEVSKTYLNDLKNFDISLVENIGFNEFRFYLMGDISKFNLFALNHSNLIYNSLEIKPFKIE